jgi:hypothetical protein
MPREGFRKNYCNLKGTCSHGDVCESRINNVIMTPMCYDKVQESDDMFSEKRRDEPKQELLF